MSQHGAQFAFDRHAARMREFNDLPGCRDVLGDRQPGAVHHNRFISNRQRPGDIANKINPQLVFINDRHVVEV